MKMLTAGDKVEGDNKIAGAANSWVQLQDYGDWKLGIGAGSAAEAGID